MTPFQEIADTTQTTATAYDSIWANPNTPLQAADGLEQFMLGQGKIYTVLIVVLIIWAGIALFILRTDRKLRHLERMMDERIAPEPEET
ncbi:MAG: CcmD family protein [Rhodothermales bacterium]